MIERTVGRIEVEGDTLLYKVTGEGIPILFIAGGGGDGDLFLPLGDQLSEEYKIITYDRRANARSTMHEPDRFDIQQQARDAAAILDAAGEPDAVVFGSSSGAVIALEMARQFPERVIGVIAHEPPLTRMHPDSGKWRKFFRDCYRSSLGKLGPSWAAAKFLFGIEVPVPGLIAAQRAAEKYVKAERKEENVTRISSGEAARYLIRQELIRITEYKPDLEALREMGDRCVIAAGDHAREQNTFLYEVAVRLAEELGVNPETMPGHHGSFMNEPEAWADRMRELLDKILDTEEAEAQRDPEEERLREEQILADEALLALPEDAEEPEEEDALLALPEDAEEPEEPGEEDLTGQQNEEASEK